MIRQHDEDQARTVAFPRQERRRSAYHGGVNARGTAEWTACHGATARRGDAAAVRVSGATAGKTSERRLLSVCRGATARRGDLAATCVSGSRGDGLGAAALTASVAALRPVGRRSVGAQVRRAAGRTTGRRQ